MLDAIQNSALYIRGLVLHQAEDLLLKVLAAGPIPQHVAFVMDGNRRYARQHQKQVQDGHSEGFGALKRVLEVCMKLNIRCVSAYAFALENFKRSPEEVDALMELAESKLLELCQHGELLDRYGVRLNIVGKKALLPEKVLAAVEKAEALTRENTRSILNICMPYGSRDEITTAVEYSVRNSLKNKQGEDIIITEKDIEDNLLTSLGGSPPLDILIRTSGVKRLSDFLLWQCCEDTQIHFTDVYWPDFGLKELIPILLDFQRQAWRKQPAPAAP
ncbi:dehydrodolichyl diphosphate synthetase [Ephemerocybe angulata]|uniref:Alkyl transferase n=1 Tax=Ephemerocybe angulata TaxID=980116 RepID=A0A8H6HPZ7_9AGAR|nr:dehydrodolichyl diphosphate synthetase [Tulosesus angulatus]